MGAFSYAREGFSPMSDLMADLKAAKPKKPRLAEWLIALPAEERAAFDQAIKDGVPSDYLTSVVRKHGGATTPESLDEYRARVVSR